MSFGPYLGGKRICLGKTFADLMIKFVLTTILAQVKFNFIDQEHYIKKPNNHFHFQEPKLECELLKADD